LAFCSSFIFCTVSCPVSYSNKKYSRHTNILVHRDTHWTDNFVTGLVHE
jgi:hypothetical protein